MPKLTEDEIARQSATALMGNELDEPVPYTYTNKFGEDHGGTFAFAHEGLPEWCQSDYPDRFDRLYFTALTPAGDLPKSIVSCGVEFELVTCFSHSGETECVHRSGSVEDELVTAEQANGPTEDVCAFCEAPVGEAHGHIYWGCDWGEAIYREKEEES